MKFILNCLYRIYHYCIAAPILLVLTIITCIITIVGCLFDSDYWGYYPAKWWARAMCFFFGVRPMSSWLTIREPTTYSPYTDTWGTTSSG